MGKNNATRQARGNAILFNMEKRLAAWALLLTLLLAACGNDSGTPKVPVEPASMFFERSYHFCTDLEKDRFLIGYYGSELLSSDIYFYILNPLGDTIHQQAWSAAAFGAEVHGEEEVLEQMQALIDQAPSPDIKGKTTGPGFVMRASAISDTIAFCRKSHRVIQL